MNQPTNTPPPGPASLVKVSPGFYLNPAYIIAAKIFTDGAVHVTMVDQNDYIFPADDPVCQVVRELLDSLAEPSLAELEVEVVHLREMNLAQELARFANQPTNS